jgi:hypothetical protein
MSEVDRLSNSGLYPALPIADQRGSKEDPQRRSRDGAAAADKPPAKTADPTDPKSPPRPPKSLIDEYA